jgi:uncharacterized protein YjiS (DUF1127 family)
LYQYKSKEAKMPQTHIQRLSLRGRQSLVARIMVAFSTTLSRRRDRQRLGKLDAHMLRDIGLEAREAQHEAAKPFWQP